jgi:tetratricopeptide (TPR) repeat protein
MSGVDAALPDDNPRMAGLAPAVVQRLHAAARAIRDGQPQPAEKLLKEALAAAPGHPEVLRLLGIHLTRSGRAQEGLASLRRALEHLPDDAVLHTDLGSALRASGDIEGALASWRHACELQPDYAVGWYNLGRNLQLRGETEAAVEALQRATQLSPELWPAAVLLGDALVHLGRFEDAAASYRAVLAQQPGCGDAWRGLANIKTQPLSAADRAQLRELLAQGKAVDADRIAMGHALGKSLEDAGEYEPAFEAIAEANARQARLTPWRAQGFHADMQAMQQGCKLLPRPKDPALGNEVVFIVGMPRSGSTLVEQILAAHSQVTGASELNDLEEVIREEAQRRRQGLLHWLRGASAADWHRLGTRYLERTARWRRDSARHTDKMPENWRYAGLLRAMLPGAKIIETRRDRLETGWSCFKQQFYAQPHFANTLEDIAAYQRDCEQAMDAWRAQDPARIRLQEYEVLVAQPQTQIRELLAFCGLPFEEACLQFHAAERSVRTASAAQVRQPLRGDTSRAIHYAPRLDPLREPPPSSP